MEMRKLQATDLFSVVRILNLIGFKTVKESIDFDKIKEARNTVTEENKDKVANDIGNDIILSVIGVLIENLPNIETELYKWLGSLTGMKADKVAKLGINEFLDLLIEITKKEEFADFFSRASKLIK